MKHLWVAGSREFPKLDIVERSLRWVVDILWPYWPPEKITILHGAARGVDTVADVAAMRLGYNLFRLPADWAAHGKAAGPIRNEELCERADALLAFWDGESRGTKNSIELARKKGIPVVVVEMRDERPA